MLGVGLLVSAGLLTWLAQMDLCQRRLANGLVGAYAAMFWVVGLGGPSWSARGFALHLTVAALAFGVLFALFALGAMGGGDVKLGTAVLLWAGPGLALPVVVVVAWSGGLLAVAGWLLDRRVLRAVRWRPLRLVRHGLSARRGVPYGVAFVCGGMFILWQQYRVMGAI